MSISRVVKKFTYQRNQSQYLNKPKTFQTYGNFLEQSHVTSKLIEKVRTVKDRMNRSQALPIVLWFIPWFDGSLIGWEMDATRSFSWRLRVIARRSAASNATRSTARMAVYIRGPLSWHLKHRLITWRDFQSTIQRHFYGC